MTKITAMGELLIDFATKEVDSSGYPLMKANPGGAPCNFLAALTRYGMETSFIGKVGRDAFGNMLIGTLKQLGINTSGVVQSEDFFTTLAFVTFDKSGDREFSFSRKPGADTQITYEECNLELVKNAEVFHFGTLSLVSDPACQATKQLVAYAKKEGKLITFDPNLRKPLWDSEEHARQKILWGLRTADVVKISDEEVSFLWGSTPEEGARKLVEEFGVKLVFVTLGSKGCFYRTEKIQGMSKCPKVKPIDTTGAGDIFGGSAVSGLLKTGKSIVDLTSEELSEITCFACCTASLSTEHSGGLTSVPDEEEVRRIMISLKENELKEV